MEEEKGEVLAEGGMGGVGVRGWGWVVWLWGDVEGWG